MGGLYHDPGVPPAVLAQAKGSEISGAILEVGHSDRQAGYYSRYFLIPKKDGGLRPILDIMGLNK